MMDSEKRKLRGKMKWTEGKMRGMRVTDGKMETERKCVRLRGEMRKTEGGNLGD